MNLMTLQRYKNEIILFLALLFASLAFFYKYSATAYVDENRVKIQNQIAEMNEISNYKEMWNNKKTANKVKILQNIVPNSKVKAFRKKSGKLIASYVNLTAKELNKLNNKLINMPVQIMNFQVKESSKNIFSMEFTCKW